MSYILDALKKADAERERGTIPGLHSQPLAPAPDDGDERDHDREPRGAAARSPLVWVGVGVGACLVGVLAVALLMREPDEPPVASGTNTGVANPDTAPLAQTTRGEGAAPADVNRMPSGMQAPADMPAPTPYQATPGREQDMGYATAPPAQQTPAPVNRNRPSPRDDASNGNATTGSMNSAGRTAPTQGRDAQDAGAGRIPTYAELPEDVRRDIPALTIGGAMYSDTAANRMLVINGQVFHEGDQPYQGLVLEEIRLKSAVFKQRNTRFSIAFRD
jgi:general secretion pathway protein B